jgi:hypothetical protein
MPVAHRPPAARTSETALIAVLVVLVVLGACAASSDEASDDPTAPPNVGTFGADPVDAGLPGDTPERSDGGPGGSPGAATGSGFRLLHAMPNVGPVVLCKFPGLNLTDLDQAASVLATAEASGEPVYGEDGGIAFGTISPWFALDLTPGGVLSLHRAVPTAPDAGVETRDAGQGRPDGGAVWRDGGGVGVDGGIPQARACDPSTLETVLPMPFPEAWLTFSADNADAGTTGLVGGTSVDADDAVVFGTGVGSRGIRTVPAEGVPTTLVASGVALNAAELAKREAHDAGVEARYGPRLLFSAPPPSPAQDAISLSLAHLVPDLSDGQVERGLRACIAVDGEEGRALPTMTVAPVVFRERVLLAGGLSATASYRVRVFSADDVGLLGQDCANTSRSPLAQLSIAASDLEAGRAYTVVLSGLAAPERICATVGGASLARPGCVAGSSRELRAILVAD